MRVWMAMKNCIHETVSRLLELESLEERLRGFKRSREDTSDVDALIDSLRANIPLAVLVVHDRMRDRGRRSLAEVRHGVCSGCHLALAIGNVHELMTGALRRCGNCGRYLYVVDDEGERERSSVQPTKRKSVPAGSALTNEAR